MALGSPVLARPTIETKVVRPAQIPAHWVTIGDAGVMDDADASTITDPDAEITGTDSHILKVGKMGTTLRLRMKYDDGITLTTSPIVKVFGRTTSTDVTDTWQVLTAKDADTTVTLTVDLTNDVSDGTNNWTISDPDKHSFDLDGCDEILVGVETAFAVSGGDATTATLEAKVI